MIDIKPQFTDLMQPQFNKNHITSSSMSLLSERVAEALKESNVTVPHTLPAEGEIITRPFLVDPITRQPIPVRVVEIRDISEMQPNTLAVVVTRTLLN